MNEVSTNVNEVADEVYADRVIRNGLVAVLYSPGYGAGWRTWNDDYGDAILFDPWIVDILLNDNYSRKEQVQRILAYCTLKYPNLYTGGVRDLTIEWIPVGTAFRIDDYDGNESIEFRDSMEWMIA